jgi:pyridoxal phosphate enzyme (YggS family)
MVIVDNLHSLLSELGQVKLVAVTKGRPAEDITALLQHGVNDIAENRLQEAEEKFASLAGNPLFSRCTKHFIGHVQSNKAKRIAKLFDVVQSVDSIKTAESLSAAASSLGKTLTIFIEVNAAGEPQRYGAKPADAPALANTIASLPNIRLVGIMGMGPQGSEAEIRGCFRKLKDIQQQLSLPHLSMGMSSDYKIAVQEGATMVRIGSLLYLC